MANFVVTEGPASYAKKIRLYVLEKVTGTGGATIYARVIKRVALNVEDKGRGIRPGKFVRCDGRYSQIRANEELLELIDEVGRTQNLRITDGRTDLSKKNVESLPFVWRDEGDRYWHG